MNAFISLHRKHLLLPWIVLALGLFACVIPGFRSGSSVNSNDLLPEPSVGLDGLQSYHAVYDLRLQGSVDGNLYDRRSHLETSVVNGSTDEELLWQEQQTGSEDLFQDSFRVGNAVYTRSQDGQDCWGEADDQSAGIVPQPASLLLPVTRADQVGSETVNGVPTLHFHFDQDGLSSGGEGTTGEVWIAQPGGYVVKYTLSIPGPANPTGSGAEIAETLSYELTMVNSIDQIELPAGCVPVLVDLPAMADAQDVYRSSGYMDYTSPSGAAQVIDFYNQALPALGWTLVEPSTPPAQTDSQILEYTQGDQTLTLFLNPAGSSLEVTAVLYDPSQVSQQPTETAGASPTPGVQPTVDASQSGLPADVPLYPGVTNLYTMPTGVRVSSSDPVDSVAAFYNDQLSTLGWDLLTELRPDADTVQQSWMKSDRILAVIILADDETTTIMLVLNDQ